MNSSVWIIPPGSRPCTVHPSGAGRLGGGDREEWAPFPAVSGRQHRVGSVVGEPSCKHCHHSKSFCLMNQANPQERNVKVANVFTGKAGEVVPKEKGNCSDATERKGASPSWSPINFRAAFMFSVPKPVFPTHTDSPAPTQQPQQPYVPSVRAGRDGTPALSFCRVTG